MRQRKKERVRETELEGEGARGWRREGGSDRESKRERGEDSERERESITGRRILFHSDPSHTRTFCQAPRGN